MPILQRFIAGAKEEFADAVANGGGIYAVGYCFGAVRSGFTSITQTFAY